MKRRRGSGTLVGGRCLRLTFGEFSSRELFLVAGQLTLLEFELIQKQNICRHQVASGGLAIIPTHYSWAVNSSSPVINRVQTCQQMIPLPHRICKYLRLISKSNEQPSTPATNSVVPDKYLHLSAELAGLPPVELLFTRGIGRKCCKQVQRSSKSNFVLGNAVATRFLDHK